MAWSSFEKDKLLVEGWRKFLVEEQTVFGINSKENPESLYSFLTKNKAAIGLSDERVQELLNLMLAQTKEDDVVLEAIGGPQRDARTFSSDTTTKLNALIKTFGLDPANEKKLEKVLNRWAKLNTVTFEPDEDEGAPTPAAEPQTARAPAGEEEAEVEKNFDTETGLPISEKGRNSIIKQIDNVTKKEEFFNLYDKLAKSKFSNNNRKDSFHKARKNRDYNYLSGFDAGPEAQRIIRQKFIDLFLTDEEEAETDRAQSAPSTEPAEQPADKTPAQTAVDLLNGIEGSEQPEITVELFNDFVRDLKSFIGEINRQKRKVSEITRKQVAPRFNITASQLNKFITNNSKYIVIFNRLRFANKDENVLNSFLRAFEQVTKSLSADTPAEPDASTPDTSAEPAEDGQRGDIIIELEDYQKAIELLLYLRPEFESYIYRFGLSLAKLRPVADTFAKILWSIKRPSPEDEEEGTAADGGRSELKNEHDKMINTIFSGLKQAQIPSINANLKKARVIDATKNAVQNKYANHASWVLWGLCRTITETEPPSERTSAHSSHNMRRQEAIGLLKKFFDYNYSIEESLMLRWKTIAGIK